MVEMWIWKPPDVILSAKLPTLDIWLNFVYFSTFLLVDKNVDKIDLEASRYNLTPKIVQLGLWTSGPIIFLIFYYYIFLPRGKMVDKSLSGGLQM